MATNLDYYQAPDHFNWNSFAAVNVCMTFQTAATFVLGAVPAAAPLIAYTLGISSSYMGIYLALENIGTFIGSLLCGALIKRHGPVRMMQWSLLLGGISLLAFTCPYLVIYAIFGIFVGMSDASVLPGANSILIRAIPRDKLDFWISLKQSSAVVGTAIVSFMVPWIGDNYSWQLALWICGGICILIVIVTQFWRKRYDAFRDKHQKIDIATDFKNVAMVWHTPRLRRAAILCLFYEGLQMCLLGFFIVFLVDQPQLTIVYAGLCLSMLNVGAFFGRIFFGWIGSTFHKPKLILGWIGILMGILTSGLMFIQDTWAEWVVLGCCIGSGFFILGWKGVWLALVAREAPIGKVSAATGGCDFISYIGAILLPILIEVIEICTGSYRYGFWVVSAMASLTGIWYLIVHAPSLNPIQAQSENQPTAPVRPVVQPVVQPQRTQAVAPATSVPNSAQTNTTATVAPQNPTTPSTATTLSPSQAVPGVSGSVPNPSQGTVPPVSPPAAPTQPNVGASQKLPDNKP